ncbi:competence protein CoiA family protein [Saccharopolyspora sp. NPDC002578]
MSTQVRYTPEDRVLDLARLSTRDHQLIQSLRGSIVRGQGTLLCLESGADGAAAEMFIRRCSRGRYWAVHFVETTPCDHGDPIESDEHRRQKDYWCRAAEDAGYRVSMEFSTGRGTRLDVAIEGPRLTGIEVQRSYAQDQAVKARTTKSYRAGWLPIWFLDSDRTPDWVHHVPAVNSTIPWSDMPPRRAATARGLSEFSALKCTPGAFAACPDGRKRPCGGWHPHREPWIGLTIDDVAALAPAERIVPMRDTAHRVYLTSPRSLELYRELTGSTGEYMPVPGSQRKKTPSGHSTECANPRHEQRSRTRYCGCGQEIFSLTQLVRARDDVCEACRIKLGLPVASLRGSPSPS